MNRGRRGTSGTRDALRWRSGLVGILVWAALAAAFVAAQEAPAPPVQPPPAAPAESLPAMPDSGPSLVRTLGGLGIVLALITAGYFAARRFAPRYFAKRDAHRSLRLVENLAMGEKRSVAIIAVEDRHYLIGNTPNGITLLAAIPGTFAQPEEPAEADARASGENSFRSLYEMESGAGRASAKIIPPEIQAKMRRLREALER